MSVSTLVKSIQNVMRKDAGVDGDAQRISQLCWMFFLKIIDDQDQELELFDDGYRSPVPGDLRWRSWAADPEGITGEELLDFVNGELFPQWGGAERVGREEGGRAWKVSAEEVQARGYNLDVKNPHAEEEELGDPEALLEELTSAEAEVAAARDELKRVLTEALLR